MHACLHVCMYAKQLDILVGVAVLSDHDRYRVAIAKYSRFNWLLHNNL